MFFSDGLWRGQLCCARLRLKCFFNPDFMLRIFMIILNLTETDVFYFLPVLKLLINFFCFNEYLLTCMNKSCRVIVHD